MTSDDDQTKVKKDLRRETPEEQFLTRILRAAEEWVRNNKGAA